MTLLVITIAVALVFDFTNGFHDTANAVATSVSTRALSPRLAVLIAAVANLIGAFATTAVAKTVGKGIIDTGLATPKTVLAAMFGAIAWNLLTWWRGLPSSSSHALIGGLIGAFATTAVAKTVGKGIIDTGLATPKTVLAAMFGAIAWNLLTWWRGLPSSSSHALIGGLIGAALAQSGSKGVQWEQIKDKVLIPGLTSPVIGFIGAGLLLVAIYWLFLRISPGHGNRGFRIAQLFSGTFVAFTHGANDAQKTMGVIALALYTHGSIDSFYIPTWVIAASGIAIGAGTYSGGWRIMRTMGQRIFKMQPESGFAAQTACAATLYATAHLGYPVSTTHVISGSVMGSGAVQKFSAVRWGVAGNILVAWVLTIPAAAVVAALLYYPVNAIF